MSLTAPAPGLETRAMAAGMDLRGFTGDQEASTAQVDPHLHNTSAPVATSNSHSESRMHEFLAGSHNSTHGERSAPAPLVARVPVLPPAPACGAPVAIYTSRMVDVHDAFDHAYARMAEDMISVNHEHMSAVVGRSGDSLTLTPKHQVNTWSELQAQLSLLGYVPADGTPQGDPWRSLGIHKMEGPVPCIADINNRLRCARQMAHMNVHSQLSQEDKKEIQEYVTCISHHAATCIQDLPEIIKARKRQAKIAFQGRWLEIDADFLSYLYRIHGIDDSWKSGLHISNLLKTSRAQFGDFMLDERVALRIYQDLHAVPDKAVRALKEIMNFKYILWAPTDKGKWLALLNGLLAVHKEGIETIDIRFLVPYEPIPGNENLQTLTELWYNPCLLKKYGTFIQSAIFYKQAMRCVFTGSSGPLHHLKSILVIHCSTAAQFSPPSIVSWKSTLLTRDIGHCITVDFPSSELEEVVRALSEIHLEGLHGWEPPRRSPANGFGTFRQVIRGYMEPSRATGLDLAMAVQILRNAVEFNSCLIGSSALIEDGTAFLVEFGNIKSLDGWFINATQEILVISPSKALITTLTPKSVWEAMLTQQAQDNPNEAISCIRFRQSLNLRSTVFAKHQLLDDHVRAQRQKHSMARLSQDEQLKAALQASLRIEGLPNTSHVAVSQEIMAKVCQITGIPLVQTNSDRPNVGEWTICYRNGNEFAQRLAVQLPSSEALKLLIQRINGSGIRIGGFDLVIEVLSLHPGFSSAATEASNFILPHANRGAPCL